MGVLFGVQPDSCDCGVPVTACKADCRTVYRSLRTGATDAEVLWFEARDLDSGISVKADEIAGQPGVMSKELARGDAGKDRLVSKLEKTVKEFT